MFDSPLAVTRFYGVSRGFPAYRSVTGDLREQEARIGGVIRDAGDVRERKCEIFRSGVGAVAVDVDREEVASCVEGDVGAARGERVVADRLAVKERTPADREQGGERIRDVEVLQVALDVRVATLHVDIARAEVGGAVDEDVVAIPDRKSVV